MRVHLVDGTYELFRQHFSQRPPHRSPGGKDLKGTVGVVSSLLSLLLDRGERVTHVAVAFDNPIRSFRNDLFDGYKTEDGVPAVLLEQFDDVEAGVAALGVVVWTMKDFEADDALATGAARYADLPGVEQVRLMTPDKDLGQCIRDGRVVQVDRMRRRTIDEATQREERGVAPQSVPDFLALVGDTADGIPGLDGWGEKSASEVLATYPHLEDIPSDVSQWRVKPRSAERLAAALAKDRPAAMLYRTLATLRTDAPIDQPLEALEWRGPRRAIFTAWCEATGAQTLISRVPRWSD